MPTPKSWSHGWRPEPLRQSQVVGLLLTLASVSAAAQSNDAIKNGRGVIPRSLRTRLAFRARPLGFALNVCSISQGVGRLAGEFGWGTRIRT